MTRLLSLEVAGFRGFGVNQVFDLNADAIVVVGANGNGKTSFFDAILWAISGRVPRLGSEPSLVTCRFVESGQARVVLKLKRDDSPLPVTITRTFDGGETRITVETDNTTLHGPEAEGRLIQLTWPQAATSPNPGDAVAAVLTRSVYLQQDLVRQFIESVTDQERFAAVSELVGAGRVTELQTALERAKAAWSKATNTRLVELTALRSKLNGMEHRASELKSRTGNAPSDLSQKEWKDWWEGLIKLGFTTAAVSMSSREAAATIDSAIQYLDGLRRRAERTEQTLETIGRDFAQLSSQSPPDLARLRALVADARQAVTTARAEVVSEQTHVAELRRMQAEVREKSEQLRALATLALKHLGEFCPVCEQAYDRDSTRQRLESLAKLSRNEQESNSGPDRISAAFSKLTEAEKHLAGNEAQRRSAEQAHSEREILIANIDRRFGELNIKHAAGDDRLAFLKSALDSTRSDIQALTQAQRAGEAFSLRVSRASDEAALRELEHEIVETRNRSSQDEEGIAARMRTGEQAQRVIEALRDATSQVVTDRVREMEPLLSDMYSRIDVHPAFRVVRFLASVLRGKGLLSTIVSDPLSDIECSSPSTVLSSSQMNALAVCVFLALNLGMSAPPLEVSLLDDPLQSLDDINLLGLIDLLRRTKDQRQLCVSTHDARFGALLARKLRPRSGQQRTLLIELEGWTRQGPIVSQNEIFSDPVPIRLMAS